MFYYKILLGTDIKHSIHSKISKELAKLDVEAFIKTNKSGALIRVSDSEFNKLPIDEETKERYLPTGIEEGFSIYPDSEYDEMKTGWEKL